MPESAESGSPRNGITERGGDCPLAAFAPFSLTKVRHLFVTTQRQIRT